MAAARRGREGRGWAGRLLSHAALEHALEDRQGDVELRRERRSAARGAVRAGGDARTSTPTRVPAVHSLPPSLPGAGARKNLERCPDCVSFGGAGGRETRPLVPGAFDACHDGRSLSGGGGPRAEEREEERGTRRVQLVREEGRDASRQYRREGGGGGERTARAVARVASCEARRGQRQGGAAGVGAGGCSNRWCCGSRLPNRHTVRPCQRARGADAGAGLRFGLEGAGRGARGARTEVVARGVVEDALIDVDAVRPVALVPAARSL